MLRQIKRNAPIAHLIKDFANKKSGKVTESRVEIKRRFEFLDWKVQKNIMQIFLDSGKGDRDWAYSRLIDYWDKSFEKKIKALWEEWHEVKCSWLILRYFPEKYIVDNYDTFTGEKDYYFLCLRLARNKYFFIDKSKLSKTDYLSVIYHIGRNIEENEAEQILYEVVHDTCLDCEPWFAVDKYRDVRKGEIMGPSLFQNVALVLYYLRKLDHTDVTDAFWLWNEHVQGEIFKSPEFKKIQLHKIDDTMYKYEMIRLARKYSYLFLDDKYKKETDPTIEEMLKPKHYYIIAPMQEPLTAELEREEESPIASDPDLLDELISQNPAVERLVKSFELETNTDELPF